MRERLGDEGRGWNAAGILSALSQVDGTVSAWSHCCLRLGPLLSRSPPRALSLCPARVGPNGPVSPLSPACQRATQRDKLGRASLESARVDSMLSQCESLSFFLSFFPSISRSIILSPFARSVASQAAFTFGFLRKQVTFSLSRTYQTSRGIVSLPQSHIHTHTLSRIINTRSSFAIHSSCAKSLAETLCSIPQLTHIPINPPTMSESEVVNNNSGEEVAAKDPKNDSLKRKETEVSAPTLLATSARPLARYSTCHHGRHALEEPTS